MTGKIPEQIIADIRDRVSIKDVVEDYVTLKKDGVNYKGLCPFHQEKTPSFKVHEGKGIFKCFGCGESGNAITFLMKKEAMTFREAVERLAARAGIELPRVEPTPEEAAKEKDQARLFLANQLAADFYHRFLLEAAEAVPAKDYLKARGYTKETVVRYQLGYSPAGWHSIEAALAPRGANTGDLLGAGLLIAGDRGPYDRFRGRLMFPIHDVQGRVRGFGARQLINDPEQPKYINSPESPIYKKGQGFYGIYQAKEAIRRAKRAIVVEGYFDQIALDRAGIAYAVAALGTALTADHARIIRRYADELFMIFDADEAGQKAALRSLEPFLDEGVSPRIVLIPDGKDPDEFLSHHPPEDFLVLLQSAPPLLSHYMDRLLAPADTPANLARAVAEAASMIARIHDPIERGVYSEQLARKSGVPLPQVQARLRRPEPRADAGEIVRSGLDPGLYPRAELELLRLVLHHPETADSLMASGVPDRLLHDQLRAVLALLLQQQRQLGRIDVAAVLPEISDPGLQEWISRVIFENDPYADKAELAVRDLINQVDRGGVEARIQSLRRQIEQAQARGDEGLWRSLLEQQQSLLARPKAGAEPRR
jgi:DNA primase